MSHTNHFTQQQEWQVVRGVEVRVEWTVAHTTNIHDKQKRYKTTCLKTIGPGSGTPFSSCLKLLSHSNIFHTSFNYTELLSLLQFPWVMYNFHFLSQVSVTKMLWKCQPKILGKKSVQLCCLKVTAPVLTCNNLRHCVGELLHCPWTWVLYSKLSSLSILLSILWRDKRNCACVCV